MACKCETEVYSRIVGYYRPVQQWNKGKKAEYFKRKPYNLSTSTFDKLNHVTKKPDPEPEVRTLASIERGQPAQV